MENTESGVKRKHLLDGKPVNNSLIERGSPSKSDDEFSDPEIIELNFVEGPQIPSLLRKAAEIEEKIQSGICLEEWRAYALSPGGLVNDETRRHGWPALLGLDPDDQKEMPSEETLKEHPEYTQVVLDVNRSLKRFPPGIPIDQRLALQGQLTNLILRVITKYPHLRYYQGYHDVAITFLLVVGEEVALRIMEELSTKHLRDCMEPTMEKTSHLLNYVFPLIKRLNPQLCAHLDKSGVGTMFCLPWFLTWFGHSLNHYKDVVRLYDAFLATHPLMPLYLTAVIVGFRAKDLLQLDPDMATLHCFLSTLPDDLPFDDLVTEAVALFDRYPPASIEAEVEEMTRLEKEARKRDEENARKKRLALARRSSNNVNSRLRTHIERMVPASRAKLLLLAVSIALGFYAYLRGGSAQPAIR